MTKKSHATDKEKEGGTRAGAPASRVLAAPHPCLALSHVSSFLKIGQAAAAGRNRAFTVLLSSADARALSEHGMDAGGVEVLTYPGAFNRSECLDLAARYADLSPLGAAMLYVDVGVKSCEALLSHEPVWDDLVNADPPYDVFLGEPTWPCSSLVADMLDRERLRQGGEAAETVAAEAGGGASQGGAMARLFYQGNIAIDPWCEHWGVPSPATEVPQLMGAARFLLGRDAPLQFWKRLLNSVLREASRLVASRMMLRPYAALRKKAGIEPVGVPGAGIVLVPLVWGVEPPRALPPSWKPIHPVLPSPARPLSGEVGSFVDGPACAGERGLVVVAFGTQGFLSTAQAETIAVALSSLSADFCFIWRLPAAQKVLGTAHLSSHEGHVLTAEWIPQNDLLGHPKTAAFVSHVGYGSLYEAAYHGVPLVAIPLFGDQDDNAARAVLGGWGVRLDKDRFTAEELADAVRRAAGERGPSSMWSKARSVSSLVKAGSGVKDVLEWMDYAYIHGTNHLIPLRAMKSSYIAYYNLDVGMALCTSFVIATYLGFSLMKRAGGRGRKPSNITRKEKDS